MTIGTKDLVGFPSYKITKDGKIWSKSRRKWIKPFENLLKHRPNNQPYLRIALIDKNKKRRKVMVHRLVAETFLPNPDKKPFVNHINGNKQDNNTKNLEWTTNKENSIHASKNNLLNRKISNEDVKKIRLLRERFGFTHKNIANCFPIKRRMVGRILAKERRQYI
ncbi:hypothetical protein CEE45_01685 [Candidatus Heimdallarchaeota archaeon B3_Heim]|nr:MAG: hypothetical protein CEE45_01685 [Candidatus Heimdallarchaeota archaeon B3_Heim]